MNQYATKSKEEQKKETLNNIEFLKNNLEELELEHKEKWYEVKDFVSGNGVGKMKTFENWVKNVYKKQKSSLQIKLRNAIEKYDAL